MTQGKPLNENRPWPLALPQMISPNLISWGNFEFSPPLPTFRILCTPLVTCTCWNRCDGAWRPYAVRYASLCWLPTIQRHVTDWLKRIESTAAVQTLLSTTSRPKVLVHFKVLMSNTVEIRIPDSLQLKNAEMNEACRREGLVYMPIVF